VVAVTGSSGKTSTKDLIARVLATAGPTVSPQGSFNTEVGLPLTVLQADASTRFLVLEMGMRGEGHIAYLAGLVRPDISVLLNVGSAHLGLLGSREAIARAKGEIIRDLPASATAVLNTDDALVAAMSGHTAAHVVRFGESSDARVRATDVRLDERARARFTLVDTADAGADAVASTAPVQLLLSGRHHVSNALAAAAVGVVSGLSVHQVAGALGLAVPDSRWRMEVSEAPGGCTVINDAYNANPESMRAALASLAAMSGGRRTWAVLGEMRELGDAAESAHAAVGSFAVQEGVARLVCVGEATRAMHRAACDEWARVAGSDTTDGDGEPVLVPDPAAAIALLTAQVRPEDIVLVKASRSIGLEVVAEALLEADASRVAVREADEVPRA